MIRQIIACIIVCVFGVIFYHYSINYVTGRLELEWLEHGIMTNWNLRLVIILCVVGGGVGFALSRLIKTAIKRKK